MRNAEEKLREWHVLYREWSELEHCLQSRVAQEAGPSATEMRLRARRLEQQCASALAALDLAVDAIRQRRARRENIS